MSGPSKVCKTRSLFVLFSKVLGLFVCLLWGYLEGLGLVVSRFIMRRSKVSTWVLGFINLRTKSP